MKRNSTLFLKVIVILLGIAVFVFDIAALLGGNSSDDISEFSPILYVLVLSSLPFFYGLYQLMQLLKLVDMNKGFSEMSVRALRNMKNCALGVAVFFTVGMPLVYFVGQNADAPGLIAFGLMMAFISIVIATFTAVLEMLVSNGFVIKNENDLTV